MIKIPLRYRYTHSSLLDRSGPCQRWRPRQRTKGGRPRGSAKRKEKSIRTTGAAGCCCYRDDSQARHPSQLQQPSSIFHATSVRWLLWPVRIQPSLSTGGWSVMMLGAVQPPARWNEMEPFLRCDVQRTLGVMWDGRLPSSLPLFARRGCCLSPGMRDCSLCFVIHFSFFFFSRRFCWSDRKQNKNTTMKNEIGSGYGLHIIPPSVERLVASRFGVGNLLFPILFFPTKLDFFFAPGLLSVFGCVCCTINSVLARTEGNLAGIVSGRPPVAVGQN